MFESVSLIKKFVLTEKSHKCAESNTYVLKVDNNSNKILIKKAIKHLYGVEPLSVRIVNSLKTPRKSKRSVNVKKAYVSFPKDFKLKLEE